MVRYVLFNVIIFGTQKVRKDIVDKQNDPTFLIANGKEEKRTSKGKMEKNNKGGGSGGGDGGGGGKATFSKESN